MPIPSAIDTELSSFSNSVSPLPHIVSPDHRTAGGPRDSPLPFRISGKNANKIFLRIDFLPFIQILKAKIPNVEILHIDIEEQTFFINQFIQCPHNL